VCPCRHGQLHKICEDVNEVLDVVPAILRVLRAIRPIYACRSCTDGVVQGTAKTPPSRQVQIFAGLGVQLDAGLMGEACRVVAHKPLRAVAANHPRVAADLLR
jgi:transposase